MEKAVVVPEGVAVEKQGEILVVTGPKGSLQRAFADPRVAVALEGRTITFSTASTRRKAQALVGTFASHARNMAFGVTIGFEARLKAVYSHFPIKVTVEGPEVVVQNFLGERSARRVRVVEGVKIEVRKDDITVSGISKEDVGQAAGSIEKLARVTGFDKRVFQDGIHLVSKAQPKAGG